MKASKSLPQLHDNGAKHAKGAGNENRRFGITPSRCATGLSTDGIQCDRVIPACTNCIGVGAECITRKFASGPIANSVNLSHATVPRYRLIIDAK